MTDSVGAAWTSKFGKQFNSWLLSCEFRTFGEAPIVYAIPKNTDVTTPADVRGLQAWLEIVKFVVLPPGAQLPEGNGE